DVGRVKATLAGVSERRLCRVLATARTWAHRASASRSRRPVINEALAAPGGGADPGVSDLRVPTALGPAAVPRWAAPDAQDRVSAVCPARLVRASAGGEAATARAWPAPPDGAEQRAVGDGRHARSVRARRLGASHGRDRLP